MINLRHVFCGSAMRVALLSSSMVLGGQALAQATSPAKPVPDYAGAMGATPLVERDARTGAVRGKTAVEIDQAARRADPRRGERERARAATFNRDIDAMPATAADAQRQAKASPRGGEVILTSREELVPIYGVRDRSGRMRVTHSPADRQSSDNVK